MKVFDKEKVAGSDLPSSGKGLERAKGQGGRSDRAETLYIAY